MRKKMLISIALVVIMLFNCIAPLMQVQAATTQQTMVFNKTLYHGLKSYFQQIGIKAVYDDNQYTIRMESSVIDGIEGINLKEKGIKDISGLENFTNLKSLVLSSNKLNEESNLAILNNLQSLEHLDLSSNQITDVSEIEDLIYKLIAMQTYEGDVLVKGLNISSQKAKVVIDVPVNTEENQIEAEAKLPQIFQILGIAQNQTIKDQGKLNAQWKKEEIDENGTIRVNPASWPTTVTSNNDSFKIIVGEEIGTTYIPLEGLLKETFTIENVNNESYEYNKGNQNLLGGSEFILYYVVHMDAREGIIFKDRKLYNAIKEQLTEGQQINSELISFPYEVDYNNEIYYDVCRYSVDENDIATLILLEDGETEVYKIYNYKKENEYIEDVVTGKIVNTEYEYDYIEEIGLNGNVEKTQLIKVKRKNNDCRDLYVAAYDEPLALVINDVDVINKIVSLVLNDQDITDLTGLEIFVGLETKLNISYNYIDTLARIYELQLQKDYQTKQLQTVFREKVAAMATPKDKILEAYNNVLESKKSIEEALQGVDQILAELDGLTGEERAEKLKEFDEIVKNINGGYNTETGEWEDGLLQELEKAINELNSYIGALYPRLESMYNIYNKMYKLTSILIPELNYLTEEEYEDMQKKLTEVSQVKSLVNSQVSRIATLESAKALNDLEKDLIKTGLGLHLDPESENPISEALAEKIQSFEENNVSIGQWKNILKICEEINVYSLAVNYCLIERMNNEDTAPLQCFVDEYLSNKIREYQEEGIDSSLLEAINEGETGELPGGTVLYNKFRDYIDSLITIPNGEGEEDDVEILRCKGPYKRVSHISVDFDQMVVEGKTIPTNISIGEELNDGTVLNSTTFLDEILALANKFTAHDEIDRYVVLPALKRIDATDNNIETLGDVRIRFKNEENENQEETEETEETETPTVQTANLSILKNLKELRIGQNLVTGKIDYDWWKDLASLKILDLSYNFITDISALQPLKRLRYLNVSDNMLSGAFNLTLHSNSEEEPSMPKLQELILAGNSYTDIQKILDDYTFLADGDYTKYFARPDTLSIDLSRQHHEIVIENPIAYNSSNRVMEVELPPIFAQLEYIDAKRTAYGTTSSKGKIDATGNIAYVPINEPGDYEAKVTVMAKNGYPEDVTTSIGINSECIIKYSVKEIKVNSVVINEDVTRMEKGTTQAFTATVEGTNVSDTTVFWTVEGATSENTTIDNNGVLTVAADETATQITVVATSNFDDTVMTSKTIELFAKSVTSVVINEQAVSLDRGENATFTVTVTGENLEDADKAITWTVEGALSTATKIDNGVLTVGADETATTLTVKATSNYDNTKNGTSTVTVAPKSVTGVTVTGNTTAKAGDMVTFTATVEGENLKDADKTVKWEVYGATNPYTRIGETTGALTIGANEKAEKITVAAISNYDNTKVGTLDVNLVVVKTVTVESTSNRLDNGNSMTLTAKVEGANLTDAEKTVTWSVTGGTDAATAITEAGVLTIGANETAEKVTVTATSVTNPSVSGTKEIKIDIPLPTLGYTVEGGDTIVGVSPSTTTTNFKTKLITDNNYTVEVKRNGSAIADDAEVATGDIVVLKSGDKLVEAFEVVVKGDVNGDGVADSLDSSLIKAHRARLTNLEGLFLDAADIDNDNEITISDTRLLLYHRARIEGYIL